MLFSDARFEFQFVESRQFHVYTCLYVCVISKKLYGNGSDWLFGFGQFREGEFGWY